MYYKVVSRSRAVTTPQLSPKHPHSHNQKCILLTSLLFFHLVTLINVIDSHCHWSNVHSSCFLKLYHWCSWVICICEYLCEKIMRTITCTSEAGNIVSLTTSKYFYQRCYMLIIKINILENAQMNCICCRTTMFLMWL